MAGLIIVLALALAVAACGDGTDQGGSGGARDSASTMDTGMHLDGTDHGMMTGNVGESVQLMDEMMLSMLREGEPEEYDKRFIDLMIPHHEGAVMMARDAVEKAQHPELRSLAQEMIREQQREIDQLRKWRAAWYGDTTNQTMMDHQDMMHQQREMDSMMTAHLGAADSTYDARFFEMMIPHHDGAVRMSEETLDKAQHPELKAFAQKVIDDQRREIGQMEQWRGSWYSR